MNEASNSHPNAESKYSFILFVNLLISIECLDNEQYYSNLLNLLNNEEDSNDNYNGNDAPPEKQVKFESPQSKVPKYSNNNVATTPVIVKQPIQAKRTSAQIFG